MLKQVETNNDMNTIASDAIHSYIKDGYRIDANESVIDREKDKDCTFKAVLKKDVDGIECKTVITLTDNGDDKNKSCTYHKVETVGDTKWSEESRTYSCSTDKTKLNSAVKNHVMDNLCKTPRMWWDHADDNFYDYYHDTVRNIFKDFGLHCDWFGDDEDPDNKTKEDDNDWLARHRKLRKCLKLVSDPNTHDYRWVWVDDKKTSTDNKSDTDKKDTKWRSALDFPPSEYQRLDDYIKLNNDNDKSDNDEKEHIKVDAKDSEADIYNKIVNKRYKDNKAEEDKLDDVVSKIKVESAETNKTDDSIKDSKQDDGDELEDSLIKLVRYIFGK